MFEILLTNASNKIAMGNIRKNYTLEEEIR